MQISNLAKCVPVVIMTTGYAVPAASADITHLLIPARIGNAQQTSAVSPTLKLVKPTVFAALESVNWLKNGGIPIAIIAEIMRVERKSIYAWLNGTSIKDSNQERLAKIHQLLAANKKADLRSLYRFWHRPIADGQSIGKLLADTTLNEAAIESALKTLWPLAEKDQKLSSNRLAPNVSKTNSYIQEKPEAGSSDT